MNSYEVLFALVRASVVSDVPSIPSDVEVDWDEIMDLSVSHGLLAIAYDAIGHLDKEHQPSRQQRINWALSAQEIWNRYAHQKKVLSHIIAICEQHNIRLLLLKGVGLSHLYPKPESRPSGDIDFFLFEDFEKGNMLFSFGKVFFDKKHAEFDFEGVHLENHLTPLDTDTPHRRKIQSYLESTYSQALRTDDGYYLLEPTAGFVYLLAHTIRHLTFSSLVPIRNLIDLWLYLNHYQSSISPSRLFKVLDDLDMDRAHEVLLYVAESLLKCEFPQYHQGKVQESDVRVLVEMIKEGNITICGTASLSYWSQLTKYFQRYEQLKNLMPYFSISKVRCFLGIVRYQVVYGLKRFLHIPNGRRLLSVHFDK